MTSKVVLLMAILCLVKCSWCGNYGFALGQRHSNDELLHEELLSNDETTIEYVYTAVKPVSYMQLRTDTTHWKSKKINKIIEFPCKRLDYSLLNAFAGEGRTKAFCILCLQFHKLNDIDFKNVYTEVSFLNSSKIYVKLSNFENIRFNATVKVYGFLWHPDGPEPDDNIQLLLQPNESKEVYLTKSSIVGSDIIATDGAYLRKELSNAKKNSNENDNEYYNYDYTALEKTGDGDEEPDSIIVLDYVNRSVVVKKNFFIYITTSFFLIFKA